MFTLAPRRGLGAALVGTLLLITSACDKDDPMMPSVAQVSVDVTDLDFGTLDTNFGAGLQQTATVTNTGSQAVSVGPITVDGANAGDFAVTGSTGMMSLAAGASIDLMIAFDPSADGMRSASISVPTEDDAAGTLSIDLMGTGGAFSYRQVDRIGIPTLNTVFNHPPQFSKTDYNVAGPVDDLASYTDRFEVVLGAVGNADPEATAALLLPDALPVDMSATTSSFGSLTGRDLTDDAVDVALFVTVGDASLQSDNVDANDRAFDTAFPYLATPNN